MTRKFKARDLGKGGSGRPSSPQFPSILFLCSHFLNFTNLTILEPGTGYCQLDIHLYCYNKYKTTIATTRNIALPVPLWLELKSIFVCSQELSQRPEQGLFHAKWTDLLSQGIHVFHDLYCTWNLFINCMYMYLPLLFLIWVPLLFLKVLTVTASLVHFP